MIISTVDTMNIIVKSLHLSVNWIVQFGKTLRPMLDNIKNSPEGWKIEGAAGSVTGSISSSERWPVTERNMWSWIKVRSIVMDYV